MDGVLDEHESDGSQAGPGMIAVPLIVVAAAFFGWINFAPHASSPISIAQGLAESVVVAPAIEPGAQFVDTTKQQADNGALNGDRVPEGSRRDLIVKALEIAGEPVNESTIAAVNTIVQYESGWKPNAKNNWDDNAKNGVPSQGLAQTIPPTFNENKDKTGQVEAAGHNNTILDPLANLVAAANYSQARYGGVENVPGVISTRQGEPYKPY